MALQKQTDKKYQWLLPLGNVCMLLSKYLDPSTNETDHYDTAEISLKVALNTTYRIETLWFK